MLPFIVGCEIMMHLTIYNILDLMEYVGGWIDRQIEDRDEKAETE